MIARTFSGSGQRSCSWHTKSAWALKRHRNWSPDALLSDRAIDLLRVVQEIPVNVERLDLGVSRPTADSVESDVEAAERQDVPWTFLRWPKANQSPSQCLSTASAIAGTGSGLFAPSVAFSSSGVNMFTP